MSELVLTDAKVWLGQHDVSGDLNAIALEYGADPKDTTRFGSGTRTRLGGLKMSRASHQGIWQAGNGSIDESLWNRFADSQIPMSVTHRGTEGDPAYSFLCDLAEYRPGAEVGEVLEFSVAAECQGPLVRGTLALFATKTATGSGSIFDLGSTVSSSQRLYAALHILDYQGGGSLTMRVQGDDLVGFGSPTARITFNAANAVGFQWQSAAGAIAEQFYRADWTFSGTSFKAALIVGIR